MWFFCSVCMCIRLLTTVHTRKKKTVRWQMTCFWIDLLGIYLLNALLLIRLFVNIYLVTAFSQFEQRSTRKKNTLNKSNLTEVTCEYAININHKNNMMSVTMKMVEKGKSGYKSRRSKKKIYIYQFVTMAAMWKLMNYENNNEQ